MNMAISRAADYVAVVGDPVALCTTGSCRKFWHDYIEVCSREGGLFPATVTMELIHLQMQQLDSHTGTQQKDFDDISADEILEELAKQTEGIPSILTAGPVQFTIKSDEGYGFLSIAEPSSSDASRSLKDNCADDLLSDRDDLFTLVREQSQKYIHCKLCIVSQDSIHADFIDELVRQDMALKGIERVEIKGRSNCERAFSLDEVVVELLECDSGRAVGKVSGVVRECSSRKNRRIVCIADGKAWMQGIVRPLDASLPCFRTYVDNNDRENVKKRGQISVYSFSGAQPKFSHYAKINQDQPNNMLFVVRYLRWTRFSPCPLGVVIAEIPLGYDFDSGAKILAINCQIRQKFPAKALAEVDEALRHHSAEHLSGKFRDLTNEPVFTIDGEKAEDLDDAVSLVVLDNDTCRVGVHIVDVTYFVQKGLYIDNEAFERLETFYRDEFDEPLIPMLPHRLSTDLCSLLPDRRRPAVSFWYTVKLRTGEIVDSNVFRSLVKSCKKFTYREVDDVLRKKSDGEKSASKFADELRQLACIARAWSKKRNMVCVNAKHMVTELMVKVNETAASLVMDKFPDCVPLWMNRASRCVDRTSEIVPDDFQQRDSNEYFWLLKPVWCKIMKEVDATRFTDAIELLLDADRHGQELWHHLDWSEDDRQKTYQCSGSVYDDASKKPYVRVTSPMRRYMDLVSLRILVAAIENHEIYNREEIENLCQHANDGLLQKTKYQHDVRVLRRAVELKGKAAVVFPYVSSFSESSLTLGFPSVTSSNPALENLKYSGLDLVRNPVVQTSVTLDWLQRIYDLGLQQPNAAQLTVEAGRTVALPNGIDRYCYRLPTNVWKSVIEKAKFSNTQELDRTMKTVHNEHIYSQITRTDSPGFVFTALTAEIFNRPDKDFREHFIRMSLGMSTGSFTQVQLTADVIDGMLKPTVQLFCVTPKLDICVEHRQKALKCFSREFAEPASQRRYQSVEAYQQAWLPVVSMEAANSAVEEGGASICGARIKWWIYDGQIHGRIQLEKDFCKRRQISFYPMNARYFEKDYEDYELLPKEKSHRIFKGPYEFDYLCIRYTGSLTDEDMFGGKFPPRKTCDEPNRRKTYAEVVMQDALRFRCRPRSSQLLTPKSPSWVGHGITTYITKFSRKNKPPLTGSTKMINVHFKLHQHSSEFPMILLSKGLCIDCTVEWMPKPTPQQ